MVLFNVDGHILASHLPLHHPKHNYQLIVELDTDKTSRQSLVALLEKETLVTFVPVAFSLTQLINKDLNELSGQIWAGHFERKGTLALENIHFSVKRHLLTRSLNESLSMGLSHLSVLDNNRTGWFSINVSKNRGLLVRRIEAIPDFDQIIEVSHNTTTNNQKIPNFFPFKTESPLKASDLSGQDINWIKQVYLETSDFER